MREISRFQVTCVVTSCAYVVGPMTSAMSAAESSSLTEAGPIPVLLPRIQQADNRTATCRSGPSSRAAVVPGPCHVFRRWPVPVGIEFLRDARDRRHGRCRLLARQTTPDGCGLAGVSRDRDVFTDLQVALS